jgi:rhodanese-related sulfurtransferase
MHELPTEKGNSMKRKNFNDLVADLMPSIQEVFPWDVLEEMESNPDIVLLDVRCPIEYQNMHIENSINVPRGVLETACDWGYEQTLPELVEARGKRVVVICRSGKRSVLAAFTLQLLGYENVASLKTGLRGWNDSEQELVNPAGRTVNLEDGDDYFQERVRPEQLGPRP